MKIGEKALLKCRADYAYGDKDQVSSSADEALRIQRNECSPFQGLPHGILLCSSRDSVISLPYVISGYELEICTGAGNEDTKVWTHRLSQYSPCAPPPPAQEGMERV